MERLTDEELIGLWKEWILTDCPSQKDAEQLAIKRLRMVSEAQIAKSQKYHVSLIPKQVREEVAKHYMVQCQNGDPFECPHLNDCPHEDKEICQWQREKADQILSLVNDWWEAQKK